VQYFALLADVSFVVAKLSLLRNLQYETNYYQEKKKRKKKKKTALIKSLISRKRLSIFKFLDDFIFNNLSCRFLVLESLSRKISYMNLW